MKPVLKTWLKTTAIAAGLLAAGAATAADGAGIGAATFNAQGELVLPGATVNGCSSVRR